MPQGAVTEPSRGQRRKGNRAELLDRAHGEASLGDQNSSPPPLLPPPHTLHEFEQAHLEASSADYFQSSKQYWKRKYVMVMGVVRSCSPEPVLRAIKMTDLSENPIHKSMWDLEVEDLHRVIP
ncbi:recQ-mediated genome instability protein 2 [Passer montanus]|uniref:recQ-mediated genome instability protein 2 n=1 Tax=Passer montanus TaxID=9160 RepID=UPI00195F5B8C|nr:recQ-mediated genome instability protein 2 [Passer montanus]